MSFFEDYITQNGYVEITAAARSLPWSPVKRSNFRAYLPKSIAADLSQRLYITPRGHVVGFSYRAITAGVRGSYLWHYDPDFTILWKYYPIVAPDKSRDYDALFSRRYGKLARVKREAKRDK